MKTYTFAKLKSIAKQQGYKTVALEDAQGNKVQSFNPIKKNVQAAIDAIEKRLQAEVLTDGVYFVCFASSVSRQNSPDRYPIAKGQVSEEMLKPVILDKRNKVVEAKGNEVLSWEQAIKMNEELANLRAENAFLKTENAALQAELDEIPEEKGLEESQGSGVLALLKENAPVISSALDRYFNLEEKKLELQSKRITHGGGTHKRVLKKSSDTPESKKIMIVPGSPEHMAQIEFYHKKNNTVRLNQELDKLLKVNPELHDKFCEDNGLFEEEEENENEEEQLNEEEETA